MKKNYRRGSKERIEETKIFWEKYRKKITFSKEEWKKYLIFSSKIFKHDFTTQVLTYGQNPNVMALADFDTWNKLGKRIHKGAKSIASFDIADKNLLMHLYDISQVYGRDDKIPQIYSLKEQDRTKFVDIYNKNYNKNFISIGDVIDFEIESAYEEIRLNEDYEVDKIKNAIKDSAKITVFARNYESEIDNISIDGMDKLFEYIKEDERKLIEIGTLVSNISCSVLREMESIIKVIEQENAIAATKESINQKLEKQKEPPVIVNNNINIKEKKENNLEKEEIKKLKNEELEVQGQGNEEIKEEIHVHIPDKDIDDTFLENKEKEQINLFDFVSKSEEIQYIDIDTKVLLEGKTFKIIDIDFENDLVKLEDDNVIMPIRRTDYGVDAFLANHNLQIDSKSKLIQISESMISENSIKNAAIRKCLLKGSGVIGGKGRIVEIFNKYKDEKDIVSAIKKEYGLGGGFGQTFLSAMYSPSKGIDISTDWDDKKYKISLTWKQVAKEIKKLIDSNEYIRDYKKLELNNDFIIENLEKSPLFQNNKVELKVLASDRILLKEKLKELFLSQKSYFTDDFAWKNYEENGVDFFKRDKKELFTSKVINLDDLSNIVFDLLDEKKYIQENYSKQEMSKEETTVYENIAFQVEDKFLLIEESDEGYSYQLFDEDYNQMDGGEVDFELDVSKEDKLIEIFELAELEFEKRVEIDYNDFIEDTLEIKEEVEYENIIKALCYEGGYHNKNLDDIVSFYKNNSDIKDRENFVKTLYKEKLFHEFSVSEEGRASKKERMSLVNWGEYLDIREGTFISAKRVSKLSWKEVGEYFKDIVEKAISKDISAEIEEFKDETYKINYKTTSFQSELFSPKKVTSQNIEAIKTLKQIEKEERLATSEEQEILSKYKGWGGVPQVFDENNKNFEKEYSLLKEILSEEEYKSARASVNNAHYTDLNVIEAMHEAIESFGFKKGKILEPSMGVGNFFSVMPENFQNSKLYGVELDDISGGISKQLYQKAQINICGFEETKFNDNFFDIAIGNVPFGDYKVFDKAYSKYSLNIHDYFFIKSIDKLKIGGILAFITSKGTLDKLNPNVRKMMAEKADFLGAVRLPNTAFKDVAGTDVTSDIIFLQKRDELSIEEPSWVNTALDKNNLEVNSYFVENPEMILGEMVIDERRKGMFGNSSKVTTCINKDPNFNLKESLKKALGNIKAEIRTIDNEIEEDLNIDLQEVVLNNDFENYSFQNINNKPYFFSNGKLEKYKTSKDNEKRILGMIEIRNSLSNLINAQVNHCNDEELKTLQADLSSKYDIFVKKYGNINDKKNSVFKEDDKYNLLCILEFPVEDGFEKADIFSKRTIFANEIPDRVENAQEALIISINELGKVDLELMNSLYPKNIEEIIDELEGEIYLNPLKYNPNIIGSGYETAEEYLSGDIKEKLKMVEFHLEEAERFKKDNGPNIENDKLIGHYKKNLKALKNVIPERVEAQDISVKLGSTWIDIEDYEKFAYELFKTPSYCRRSKLSDNKITIEYLQKEDRWFINNKKADRDNLAVYQSFGTQRINAFEILEDTLNQKSSTVKDVELDEYGNRKYFVNKNETMLAREKQVLIKEKFVQWIWEDPDRRNKYVEKYNNTFNTVRPRTYDGNKLKFNGINPNIKLREHQKNGVARIIFGKNTLLAHVVGAGKSFTMIAGIMEQKRLGIANKSMLVVPNHLTGQMGDEFLRLYPGAKILVPTKKDFEKQNRQKLISKIATNNYDAIILGHSQFEKIKVSVERQSRMIDSEMEALQDLIYDLSLEPGNRTPIKRLEKQKKDLEVKLKKLTDDSKKDAFINFEQLGVDSLLVDEAHMYKNGSINTKMQNVGGLGSRTSQRAMDMLMKCQYIQEKNNGRGVVFATGTPVSNSMAEMFVMQKYLQYDRLKEIGIFHFDQWAANFGEVVSSLELAPEGSGYRFKNRFSKFFNLPELMNLFREVADIKVSEDLNLPVPKLKDDKYKIMTSIPTEVTKNLMKDFAQRAERIRSGTVKPYEDNMLKITNEARLLGTDPRLLDYDYSEEDLSIIKSDIDSKLNQVVECTLKEYKESNDIKGTQIIFSDIGTPNSEKNFTVYEYIKKSLIEKGIPEKEICFIHDAKTEIQRDKIFEEVISGSKRIIIGSTQKMGTGTNIQHKLVALHHVDCPYRPSDIEQREGRILRQGNTNEEVNIYRYVTKDTFDAYLWQMVENKQKFISQVMTSKTPLRNCEDIDEAVLSFAEVKALATGNPLIKEKMEIDNDVAQLKVLKAGYDSNKYKNQDLINIFIPQKIKSLENDIKDLSLDIEKRDKNKKEEFEIKLENKIFDDKEFAGETLKIILKNINTDISEKKIGEYKGFDIIADLSSYDFSHEKNLILKGEKTYKIELGDSGIGNIQRIENVLKSLESKIEVKKTYLEEQHNNLLQAKDELKKPFHKEEELQSKLKRQTELNNQLEIGKEDNNIIEEEIGSDELNVEDSKNIDIENETKNIGIIDKLERLKEKIFINNTPSKEKDFSFELN